jgi:hypothetical protein
MNSGCSLQDFIYPVFNLGKDAMDFFTLAPVIMFNDVLGWTNSHVQVSRWMKTSLGIGSLTGRTPGFSALPLPQEKANAKVSSSSRRSFIFFFILEMRAPYPG